MIAAALGWLVLCHVGCASFQDCQYEHSQKVRGWFEYHTHGRSGQSKHRSDYRRGWLDGFDERVKGGPDCPPLIAPSRYWKPGKVLKDNDAHRQAYYSGWQDGAAQAASLPDTHYLRVFETPQCSLKGCQGVSGQCSCSAPSSALETEPNILDGLLGP